MHRKGSEFKPTCGHWSFRSLKISCGIHQFIELARIAGYFNFQGFIRSKIPNIFQCFFINLSSIFMLHFVWTTIPTFGLLSLQTVFPFSWTVFPFSWTVVPYSWTVFQRLSSVTRLLFLEKTFARQWISWLLPNQLN